MEIELAPSPVMWSHDTYDREHTINHFTTVACRYILISNICTSLGQTKYIHYRVCYTPSGTIFQCMTKKYCSDYIINVMVEFLSKNGAGYI